MTDPATAATFVFADIAGFTALTEAHGDEQAANLVADFSQAVTAELPAFAGTQVKTIGDALMLRIPRAEDAIHFGLRLTHELMAGHGAPAVRVGLHHGTAVERDGDYFGSTVNLAARISALAVGGEVLLSGSTAALAPTIEGVIYEARGRHELRNIAQPVEIFAAVRTTDRPGSKLAVDPVCQMAVDPQRAGAPDVRGQRLLFSAASPALASSLAIPNASPGRLGRRARPSSRAVSEAGRPAVVLGAGAAGWPDRCSGAVCMCSVRATPACVALRVRLEGRLAVV